MKSSIIILALTALVFSSCSTAYRTGQTPDDVYFSPGNQQDEYVVVEKRDDRAYQADDYYENRFLRMRVQDRYRWSAFDDYYNNPYAYSPYGYYSNWNSPWNNYWAWNTLYNPYSYGYGHGFGYGYGYGGGGVIIKNPTRYQPPSRAVVFNPNSYNNGNSGNRSGVGSTRAYSNNAAAAGRNNAARYNNSNNNNSSLGGSIRKVFSGSGSGNNNSQSGNNNTPSRSYNPSSSNSSSSGSSRSSGSSGGSSSGGSRPIR